MNLLAESVKNHPLVKRFSEKKEKLRVPVSENGNTPSVVPLSHEQLLKIIVEERGKEVSDYIAGKVDLSSERVYLSSTTTRFNFLKLPYNKYDTIINLKRVNDYRWINKFFEAINEKLPFGGIFINSVEIYTNRKSKILKKYFFPFNRIYYFFDVVYTRLIPKFPVLKKLYFSITKGQNRVLSKAETLGRLYSCGFEIIDETFIHDELFFIVRKVSKPVYDDNPTYGPLIRLKRYGKGGKLFNVYKLRTMHAFSEYLQQYVYDHNSLQEGGKFKDDFRITTEGKFFRKFWIDELPMFINVFKGNMKIVGVRPLSKHYFNLYSEELKRKRIKYKPGLVPPFYVDMPKTLEEIMASEMRYLEEYEKHPVQTDIKYFFKAFYNILFKRAFSG